LIRILVGVPCTLTREGIVTVLNREDDMEVVAAVDDVAQAVAEARELKPDVALLGSPLSGQDAFPTVGNQDAFATVGKLRAEVPRCRCVILSSSRDPRQLRRATEADADGYLVDDSTPEFLIGAIRRVAGGRKAIDPEVALAAFNSTSSPLTIRESDALRMVARGSTTAEIANVLHLTCGTVRNYVSRAIGKIGARNRVDAIRIAEEAGWI